MERLENIFSQRINQTNLQFEEATRLAKKSKELVLSTAQL